MTKVSLEELLWIKQIKYGGLITDVARELNLKTPYVYNHLFVIKSEYRSDVIELTREILLKRGYKFNDNGKVSKSISTGSERNEQPKEDGI